jgi:peptidoglycan/xylan/chitin deacetylase (PgdA/CDA1 family)
VHHHHLLPLLALGLLTLCGCDRLQQKLERLASAGRTPPPETVEAPLTEEEQRINAMLQSPELFDAVPPPTEAPKAQPFELNKASIVSILGYHDFKERGGEAMVISASKFREQMQFIKDSGLPVIPLDQVLEWQKGLRNIPDESIVITMDDGWQGVYQHAFPVLKELGFPFTVYLYKNYVNIGGRSLTWEQIREMMASGLCTIGSHSVSHDSMTNRKGRSDEAYREYVLAELRDSKAFLEENLRITCTSFAYPYGNYNDLIRDLGLEVGYQSLVTVNGSKVRWDTPPAELGRFIIHGVNDSVFQLATTFRGRSPEERLNLIASHALTDAGQPVVRLKPGMNEVITDRRPHLEADLSGLGPLEPGSVTLHIAGIGTVQPTPEPGSTALYRYHLPHRLRREQCEVTVSFKRQGAEKAESLLWTFKINLAANYLPQPVADSSPPAAGTN